MLVMYAMHHKQQKSSGRKVLRLCGFLMNRESFPNKCSVQQWLSLALSLQLKQKPQMFSLHLPMIRKTFLSLYDIL